MVWGQLKALQTSFFGYFLSENFVFIICWQIFFRFFFLQIFFLQKFCLGFFKHFCLRNPLRFFNKYGSRHLYRKVLKVKTKLCNSSARMAFLSNILGTSRSARTNMERKRSPKVVNNKFPLKINSLLISYSFMFTFIRICFRVFLC